MQASDFSLPNLHLVSLKGRDENVARGENESGMRLKGDGVMTDL